MKLSIWPGIKPYPPLQKRLTVSRSFILLLFQSFYRGFLLLSIGIFMVFAADMWEIGGAGTLCALIMSFVASLIWKKEKVGRFF